MAATKLSKACLPATEIIPEHAVIDDSIECHHLLISLGDLQLACAFDTQTVRPELMPMVKSPLQTHAYAGDLHILGIAAMRIVQPAKRYALLHTLLYNMDELTTVRRYKVGCPCRHNAGITKARDKLIRLLE